MKRSKKLLLVIMAMLLALTLCGAVIAESGEKTNDGAEDAGDTTTIGATGTAAPVNNKQVVLIALDSEGNPVKSAAGSSCMGGTTLFINHDYIIEAKYYDATTRELIDTDDKLVLGVDTEADCVTVEGNRIKLASSPTPYSFTVKVADPTVQGGETQYTAGVNRFNLSLLEILIGLAGVYVIVSALRGSSNLFSDEFIKDEKKPAFRKIIRIMAIVSGLALIASAVLAIFFSYVDGTDIVRYVLLGLAFVLLIGMAVVNSVMTDREKRDKAQGYHSAGPVNPNAAFEFDGTEPTIDEVLADIENEGEKKSE